MLSRLALAIPLGLCLFTWPFLLAWYPSHSGDTAHFQFIGHVLGIPHPPGSPVYVYSLWLLGKVLPGVSPAFVVNAFSGAAGIALVYLFIRICRWRREAPIAILAAALLLTASPLFTRLSTVAEVYVPAMACLILCVERIESWRATDTVRDLYLAAAALAAAMGMYSGMVMLLPAVALYLRFDGDRRISRKQFLVASSIVVVLVLVAYTSQIPRLLDPDTPPRWQAAVDLRGAFGFLVGGGLLEHFTLSPEGESLARRIVLYGERLMKEVAWVPALLVVALLAVRRSVQVGRWPVFPTAMLALNIGFVCTYEVWDSWDFMLPGVVATSLLVAAGISSLRRTASSVAMRRVSSVVISTILVTSLVYGFQSRQRVRGRVLDRSHAELAQNQLGAVGDQAILVCDSWEPMAYLGYYLYTEPERWGSTQVLGAPVLDRIRDYLSGSAGVSLSRNGITIEPGRPVYAIGEPMVRRLESLGFELQPESHGTFRVRATVRTP